MDKREVFESRVNRALYVGALGGGVVAFLVSLWLGFTQFKRINLFVVIIVFLVGLGVVNKARQLVARSDYFSSTPDTGKVILWTFFARAFAFVHGLVLSFGTLLAIYYFSKGA